MINTQQLHELLGCAAPDAGPLPGFIESLTQRYPPTFRLRSDIDASSLPFTTEQVRWYSAGYRTKPEERPSCWLNHIAADYYIQDAGSMLALALCDEFAGLRICDLCAAPGGKSTAIVDRIGNGWLLANEPISNRTAALEFNLSRTGSSRWAVSSSDPDILAEKLSGEFDLVLVDAPCSGQTLVGRGKQREAAWSTRQIEHSAARQQRILTAAVRLLRPGGRLVYSTCTFAATENESQVDWLVKEHGLQSNPVESLADYQTSAHVDCYRLWPQRHNCAGAFAASLQLGENVPGSFWTERSCKQGTLAVPEIEDWGELTETLSHRIHRRLFAWPADFPQRWLPVATGGPEVAYQTGKTWHPGYALAMRQDCHWRPHRTIDLDLATAKALLGGQALSKSATNWQVIYCEGRPLCWGKGDGRRIRPALPPAVQQLCRTLR